MAKQVYECAVYEQEVFEGDEICFPTNREYSNRTYKTLDNLPIRSYTFARRR